MLSLYFVHLRKMVFAAILNLVSLVLKFPNFPWGAGVASVVTKM